jgi:hypothetical protein
MHDTKDFVRPHCNLVQRKGIEITVDRDTSVMELLVHPAGVRSDLQLINSNY